MKLFYKYLVLECQKEHIRLLCHGWPLALLALLTGSAIMTILAIVMLVLAYLGAPEKLETNNEQSGSTEEGRQEAL